MIAPTCFGPHGPSSGSLCRTLLKLQFCADIQQKYVVKCSAMLVKSVSSCGVYCVPCILTIARNNAFPTHIIHNLKKKLKGQKLHGTQYTPQLETLFTNIAEHLTTYFYWLSPQNCNFSKVRPRLPDDGPDGPKNVGAIMRYFNYIF